MRFRTLWVATYDTYLSKLIIIQKKIIRTITGVQFIEHSEPPKIIY